MTPHELELAINHLVESGALVLPYGAFPGDKTGGRVHLGTRKAFEGYGFNPPEYLKAGAARGSTKWSNPHAIASRGVYSEVRTEFMFRASDVPLDRPIGDNPNGWVHKQPRPFPELPIQVYMSRRVRLFVGPSGFKVADPAASAKPTWEAIEAALLLAKIKETQQVALIELRSECKRRITAAYGETDFDDEVALRLRGAATAEHNAERDRLRTIYRAHKITIADGKQAVIDAMDIYADATWAASPTG